MALGNSERGIEAVSLEDRSFGGRDSVLGAIDAAREGFLPGGFGKTTAISIGDAWVRRRAFRRKYRDCWFESAELRRSLLIAVSPNLQTSHSPFLESQRRQTGTPHCKSHHQNKAADIGPLKCRVRSASDRLEYGLRSHMASPAR